MGYTKLFAHLSAECCGNILTIIYVPAHCGIPFARLYILPQRTTLKIEPATAIEKMQMHHRMKGF